MLFENFINSFTTQPFHKDHIELLYSSMSVRLLLLLDYPECRALGCISNLIYVEKTV